MRRTSSASVIAELAGRGGPGYDIIHAHYWLSGLAALPASLELGIPMVQSFHTVAGLKNATRAAGQAEEPEFRVRAEAFLAGQAAALIAGSRSKPQHSSSTPPRLPARVWLVPPGVDTRHVPADQGRGRSITFVQHSGSPTTLRSSRSSVASNRSRIRSSRSGRWRRPAPPVRGRCW